MARKYRAQGTAWRAPLDHDLGVGDHDHLALRPAQHAGAGHGVGDARPQLEEDGGVPVRSGVKAKMKASAAA